MTDRAPSPPHPPRRRLRDLTLSLRVGVVLGAVLLGLGALQSCAVEWNDVPSRSMRPTLLEGDRIVVSKLAYDVRLPFVGWRIWNRGEPAHGDLVVYRDPGGHRAVKRVIGVPGDRVEVQDHRVLRNGIALTQASGAAVGGPYAGYRAYGEDSAVGYSVLIAPDPLGVPNHTVERVPSGEYYLLGDNRGHSRDSREIGTVSRDRIVGRVTLIAFSRDANGFREGRFLHRLR